MQVPVRVCGFSVYTAGKGSILLSGHLNVKKRNAAISFLFHCELDVAVKPVEVFQEEAELLLSVFQMTKVSSTYRSHKMGLWSAVLMASCSNSSMNRSARTGDKGDLMEVPADCS